MPRHGLSLLASSQKKLGLADRLRARSAARKTNHSHGLRTGRAMRRVMLARHKESLREALLSQVSAAPPASATAPRQGRLVGSDA